VLKNLIKMFPSRTFFSYNEHVYKKQALNKIIKCELLRRVNNYVLNDNKITEWGAN